MSLVRDISYRYLTLRKLSLRIKVVIISVAQFLKGENYCWQSNIFLLACHELDINSQKNTLHVCSIMSTQNFNAKTFQTSAGGN